jgi:DNA-binding transcriptional MerR regulator
VGSFDILIWSRREASMSNQTFIDAFSTERVAAAAGVTAARLNLWLKRDFALVSAEHESPGIGGRRLFSFARALQIALAARLIEAGISVKTASAPGAEF